MPSYVYEPKVNKNLPKGKKKPTITKGAYFLMRTRVFSGKQSPTPRINPRWVACACWVTEVFYKLLLK